MKLSNTLRILCALSSFFTFHSSFSQNVPSYVPTNGLVGWWPFNGNANDESGNGLNGSVNSGNNGTLTYSNDRNGFPGACVSLASNPSWNSLGPYIEILGTNSISLSSYSINIWIKPASNCSTGELVNKGPDNVGLLSRIQAPLAGVAFGSLPQYLDYPFQVSTTQWTMLTLVRDNNSNGQLYLNGNLVYSSLCGAPAVNNFNFSFGAMPSGGTNGSFYPYQGKLDDIAIWNRALTQQEITNLNNASLPPPCPTLPSNLQTGLLGYWPFCGNANDESGNGNHGTVNGATFTTDRFGNANMAYSFDGISNYVRSQNFSSINPTSLTVATWILPYQFGPSENYIINKSLDLNPGNINRNWGIRVNGLTGTISLELKVDNNYFIFSSSQSIATNSWSQITFTYDGNSAKVYCNNLLIISEIVSGLINASNYPLSIGYFPNSQIPPYGYFFNGKIDDICIWNRALDPTEIDQLYQTQSTPSEDGKIGVNIASPQRSLHIKDVIRLEPRNSAPDNPVRGDMYYDGILNKLRVYDGTSWQNCW